MYHASVCACSLDLWEGTLFPPPSLVDVEVEGGRGAVVRVLSGVGQRLHQRRLQVEVSHHDQVSGLDASLLRLVEAHALEAQVMCLG